MSGQLVHVFGGNAGDSDDQQRRDLARRLCEALGMTLEELAVLRQISRMTPEDWALIRQISKRMQAVEGQCQSVVHTCATQANLLRIACCPANMLHSQVTINKYGHQNQVNVNVPVTGLGGDYVDNLPVPPGKKIRLVHIQRPGYSPTQLTLALNLANNGTNYLDIAVTLYVAEDPKEQGEKIGSEYRGFQFFNNEGIPTPLKMPLYQNQPLTIGTMNYLVIELHHQGAANNLVSAFAAAHVNNEGWFAACGLDNCATPCG